MITTQDKNAFVDYIIGQDHLENAIEWISDNLDPEEVFDRKDLEAWALDYVRDTLSPEDIFDTETLEEWALEHGFKEPVE